MIISTSEQLQYLAYNGYQSIILMDGSPRQIQQISDQNRPAKVLTQQHSGIVYEFTDECLPKAVAKKVAPVIKILNNEIIDVKRLKEVMSEGIPDEATVIRQYTWKLVLEYLPPQKGKWEQTVSKQRKTYQGFIDMFLPLQKYADYPILLKKGHPRMQQFQQDYLLWEQIEKDTSRTHAQYSFFATECSEIMIPYLTSARREKFKVINGQDQLTYTEFLEDKKKQRKTYRYDLMTRILYIYSRLNPRVQYVQGMNQILAPIFYLVNINKSNTCMDQAACFFMFNNAITDIIELHIKDLDKSENGIYGRINAVNQILVVVEPRVWSRLQKLKIDPFYYSFRWMTLLFAQDFVLFDLLRIWQSVFSAEDRIKFSSFIAISIIIYCKPIILSEQFTVVLEHLQNIKQHINAQKVLSIATQLYAEFKDKQFSQHAQKTKQVLSRQQEEEDEDDRGPKKNIINKITNFMSSYF